MHVEFDGIDQGIVDDRAAARDQIDGPRLGDFVRFPNGQLERFSHNWGDTIQTSPIWAGSFHLFNGGGVSYSGGLNPATPLADLTLTDEKMPGQFWIFHHGEVGAHRGVYFEVPCRVFRTCARYEGFLKKGWT